MSFISDATSTTTGSIIVIVVGIALVIGIAVLMTKLVHRLRAKQSEPTQMIKLKNILVLDGETFVNTNNLSSVGIIANRDNTKYRLKCVFRDGSFVFGTPTPDLKSLEAFISKNLVNNK